MPLHPNFPSSPYEIISPELRWLPDAEATRVSKTHELMPPLVVELRKRVQEFRASGYDGASATSKSLLNWWFGAPHLLEQADGSSVEFQYFFAQREALETIVYLYDVVRARDKFDLMRFDSSGAISAQMFDEDWRRYVIKMATGSGKTKVMSLALAWSFFHKSYEEDSQLARNFLVIAPNIIVLDRLYRDFQGLLIFFQDPVLPANGFDGRNWREDFQLRLHKQDDVRVRSSTGNIFLTNIHRVYSGEDKEPSIDDDNTMDYFFGKRPSGKTTDSRVDLGVIVRDIDELAVINDEAHHIHDSKLSWFKSIQDIHHRLVQKGRSLSLQLDVTATPKHNNGAIFVQTVSDYPLVEAISQNIVKRPVLPDESSRAKLAERSSGKFTELYADYIHLGVIEWRKADEQHQKLGQKAVLFVMADDTENCDELAEYLESTYEDLTGAVLVIHTKNNGDISEASTGKAKEELEKLRKLSNQIDAPDSPYKAIVSVLMLKEGWDVRNVTTIVGLRAYTAKSNILPEQTLGRGLRKMYDESVEEYLSVIGTDAFMRFVETIKSEGVELERKAMGEGTEPKAPLVVEVDRDNASKDLTVLDIALPRLTPRLYRAYKNLDELEAMPLAFAPIAYQEFDAEEQREIVFRDMATGEVEHTATLDSSGIIDYRSVVAYFARQLVQKMRLVSGYAPLYGRIKAFMQDELFGRGVDLEASNTVRNLSEPAVSKLIIDTFTKAINELTVRDQSQATIDGYLELKQTRPFVVKDQGYLMAGKSVFNRIIGDSKFELEFAGFLEQCADVVSYAKNYLAVGFKLDYANANGDIANYYPDFMVQLEGGCVVLVETKGREELDLPLKMQRLRRWCADVNTLQNRASYDFVYVDQESFERHRPRSFTALMESFRDYQGVGEADEAF